MAVAYSMLAASELNSRHLSYPIFPPQAVFRATGKLPSVQLHSYSGKSQRIGHRAQSRRETRPTNENGSRTRGSPTAVLINSKTAGLGGHDQIIGEA